MKNFIVYITLIVGTLLCSCRKDKVPFVAQENASDTCDCQPIPTIEGYSTGYNHIHDSVYLSFPRFNPNNNDEIMFAEWGENGQRILYKYNLITKSKSIIFEGTIFGTPDWGKSGWIIFTRGYDGLFRVRPDGSELSLLVPGGTQFHPKFNESGDKFITYHGFTDAGFYPGKIWDIEGDLLDSINIDWSGLSVWQKQNNIACRVNETFLIVDPINKETLKTHDPYFGTNTLVSSFVWLNENEALISLIDGVYKLQVWTGQLEKLVCGCSSQRYYCGNVNSDGTKVICNKLSYKKMEGLNLLVTSSIVIFDIDNMSFEEIEIE
ncbi:MAG: hypothetical protein COA32_07395 [Fluviicola sp.]|nr:MAG: hypothetical protein COA32_07395 [Fluviicola sp.]